MSSQAARCEEANKGCKKQQQQQIRGFFFLIIWKRRRLQLWPKPPSMISLSLSSSTSSLSVYNTSLILCRTHFLLCWQAPSRGRCRKASGCVDVWISMMLDGWISMMLQCRSVSPALHSCLSQRFTNLAFTGGLKMFWKHCSVPVLQSPWHRLGSTKWCVLTSL